MAIPIKCAGCQAAFDVPDTLVGKTIRCTSCKTQLTVPSAEPPAAKTAPKAAKPAPRGDSDGNVKTKPKDAKSKAAVRRRDDDDDDDDDEDEDDRPGRGRGKKPAKKGNGGMIALIAVGAVGLIAVIGVAVYLMMGSGDSDEKKSASNTSNSTPAGGSGTPAPGGGGGPPPGLGGPPGGGSTVGSNIPNGWVEVKHESVTFHAPSEPERKETGVGNVVFASRYQGGQGGMVVIIVQLPEEARGLEGRQALKLTLNNGGNSGFGTVSNRTETMHEGLPAEDMNIKAQGLSMKARAIMGPGVLVIGAYGHQTPSAIESDGAKFISLIKVKGGNPSSTPGGIALGGPNAPGTAPGGLPGGPGVGALPGGPGPAPGGGPGVGSLPPGPGPAPGGLPGGPGVGGLPPGPGPAPGGLPGGPGVGTLPPGPGPAPGGLPGGPGVGTLPGGPGPAPGGLPGGPAPGGPRPGGAGPGGTPPPPPPPPGGGPGPGLGGPPPGLGGPGPGLGGPGLGGPGLGGPGLGGPGGFGQNSGQDRPPPGANTRPAIAKNIDGFHAFAFDDDRKEVYTVSMRTDTKSPRKFGELKVYSYPAFNQPKVFNLPNLATRAVVDSKRGLLFLATATNQGQMRELEMQQFDRASALGDVQVFDLKAIQDGKVTDGADLKPIGTISVNATIRGLELMGDGQYLIVAVTRSSGGQRKTYIRKYEAADRKFIKELALPEEAAEVHKTTDGAKLVAIELDQGLRKKQTKVTLVDPIAMELGDKITAPGIATDAATASDSNDRLAVPTAGAPNQGQMNLKGAINVIDRGEVKEFPLASWRASNNNYARFSPNGKFLLVSSIALNNGRGQMQFAGLDVYVPDAKEASGWKKTASIRDAVGVARATAVGGWFDITPDSAHVVFRSGAVLALANIEKNSPNADKVPEASTGTGNQAGGFPGGPGVGPPGGGIGLPGPGGAPGAGLPAPGGAPGAGLPLPGGAPGAGLPGPGAPPGVGLPPRAPGGVPAAPGRAPPPGVGLPPMAPGGVPAAPGGAPPPGVGLPPMAPGGVPAAPGGAPPGVGLPPMAPGGVPAAPGGAPPKPPK